MSVPIDITDDTLASSLVPVQCASLAPPAVERIGSFSSLQMFHTHTPPGGDFFSEECEAEQNVRNKGGCGSLYTYGSGGSAQFSKAKRKVKKSVLR